MRKRCPSTYDPRLNSEDIRAFKRLLRRAPGMPQKFHSATRIDENHAEVRTNIIGVTFVFLEGQWQIASGLVYFAHEAISRLV